jgi:hypothetical protein
MEFHISEGGPVNAACGLLLAWENAQADSPFVTLTGNGSTAQTSPSLTLKLTAAYSRFISLRLSIP